MSFPPTELHPVMRHHLTNYPDEHSYASEIGMHPATYSLNVPVFEPSDQPAGSSEAQHQSMAAETAQADVVPIFNNYEGEPGGPFSMDPFIDASKTVGPTYFGVLKIRNIPYDVLAKEIVHFLGRNPNMIDNHTMGCAVHIIMERPTSKTMDCFVEFLTLDAVRDQIRRHENLIQSGRPPKIGSRHVHVEESDQNELLAEIFPRAKSIVWQQGAPVVITNDDAYSTGFKGFFTREEMVGLVRHAECPQRSPFSINCLQRTFESMISTLYKASNPPDVSYLYTVADRNLLFTTYMNQMYVLVDKVENTDTKGLDQNLMRDFIFAGMNCPGFGERQKYELLTTGGIWGLAIDRSPLNYFWPFDLIGRKVGMEDEAAKSFLDLIELGVGVHVNGIPFKERFIVKPRLSTTAPPEHPHFLNNTRFQFNDDSQHLDCGTAMDIEMKLMQALLSAGYALSQEQQEHAQDGGVTDSQRQLAENLRTLQLQEQEVLEGDFNNKSTPRAPQSPAQSPKGTTAAVADASGHLNMTPTRNTSKPIDPTSKPFEPRRRLSEPQQLPGVIGSSPMQFPFRRRTNSTLSLPFPEDYPPTASPRKHAEHITPTKPKRGARISVDHTIHEEENEDLFMSVNNAKQQKPA